MQIDTLNLLNYRNYEQADTSFAPGLNMIVGQNGHGKTNLLEAVHALSTLGSHRSHAVAALVRHGQDSAFIRARGVTKSRAVSVDAEVRRTGGMRVLVNKVALERSSDADLVLTAILFSPEDLALTKGGPEERRRFLDHAAARVRPLAGAERQEFERVLKQRNGVLKASLVNPRALRQLEVWTDKFIEAGVVVVRNRLALLAEIATRAAEHYKKLSGSAEAPVFSYEPTWCDAVDATSIGPQLTEALVKASASELQRGITMVGPHRDDLAISLLEQDARTYASQGEQRSLALSMRLAERDLVAQVRNEDPILLLDDVFSELDDHRRAHLAELVVGAGQTIATTTSVERLPVSAARTLRVEHGKVFD